MNETFFIYSMAIAIVSVSTANIKGRIINGHEATKGVAPYIVSLKNGTHFCAGSIIDEHWILTASHCLAYYDSFDVIAGLHERNHEYDVQIRHVPNRAAQIMHENYTGEVAPYDIALIYVAEPFELESNPNVAKINLPSGKYELPKKVTLYGWGRDNTGEIPNTLEFLDVDIVSYDECVEAFPSDLAKQVDAETNICSFTPGTEDGSCNGDSGGPLVQYTPDGPEHFAIVSWIYIPCLTTYPTVYTLTLAYIDWIHGVMESYKTDNVLI